MRMNVVRGMVALVVLFTQMVVVPAAQDGRQGGGRRGAPPPAATGPFDAHDLSGIWNRTGGSRGISRQPGQDMPPMTPLGQKRFDASKPGYGPRAVPPSVGNDSVGECNPQGMPRILLFPRPFEIVQMPDRMLQIFQWHGALRQIWADGRTIPADFAPSFQRWYGFSAARWEGNTFVVESAGFDDRAWVDHFGYPKSERMRLEERYTRTGPDTIEVVMTITDPEIYTRPWVSEKKTLTRVPRQEATTDGFYGLAEELCVPLDELEFNRRVRDAAGGVAPK